MDGFETDDFAPWSGAATTTGWSIITTTVHGGKYAAKYSFTASQPSQFLSSPSLGSMTEGWFHFAVYLSGLSANIALTQLDLESFGTSAVMVTTDGSSNASLSLYDFTTTSVIGSAYRVSQNQWLELDVHILVSATVGTLEMYVNGVKAASSVGNLNTGSSFIHAFLSVSDDAATGSISGTVYFDDAVATNNTGTNGLTGTGSIIARQCNTATPTFNTWSFSTGSNVWNVWDNTPSGSTYAYSSTASAKQTCGLSFGNTTDTGATGHGSGKITATSVMKGAQIEWYCRNIGTDLSVDSSIWYPNGGTETDTVGPTAYTNNGSSVFEATIVATPTAAQVLNLQTGILHTASNSNEHDVWTVWAMVYYSPGLSVAHKSGVMLP